MMTGTRDRHLEARARHWAGNRRWVGLLTALWLLITFVPPFFARELSIDVFGAPLPVWLAAQGAPIAYVLIVWIYERHMDRLDRELNNTHVD